jgi:Fe2+ or Zn2+ uptake regulation protein
MTSAPNVEPLSFHGLPGAVNALRERGMRLSTSRRLVLEALFAADGPVSAEQLDPVRAQIKSRFGHEARFTHFPIVGTCAECARAEGPSR